MSLLLLLNAPTGTAGRYTHSFASVRPRARYDKNPWTRITIAEASTRNGTYTDLVTSTLTPAETDAAEPVTRNITLTGATLPAGWYRITFTDAAGEMDVFEPVFAGPATRPTVQEVARLMPDRATAASGAGLPNFDTTTEPTATAVDGLIDIVLDSVDPHVPAGASAEVERAARNVVTLTVAILTETGYFGEQRDVNDAKVRVWETMLRSNQLILDAAAQGDEPGGVRFGSLGVVSPTVGAWQRQAGLIGTELLP